MRHPSEFCHPELWADESISSVIRSSWGCLKERGEAGRRTHRETHRHIDTGERRRKRQGSAEGGRERTGIDMKPERV